MAEVPQLEGGTYEILRNRLKSHAAELRTRLDKLNAARKDVFGSIDLKLLATERVTTEHNCVPRDMVAVGKRFLLGYNVQFGLKAERRVADVLAVYEFNTESNTLQPAGMELFDHPQFQRDFQDVYRYYKDARFAKFFTQGPYLYMVFQVGKSAKDIKTFKWAFQGDTLTYVDNRSDHEVRYPPQHEFEWIRTTRDMHHHGAHPHVSIEDRIFVETVGGDLTIKIENNTASGQGIYTEPVENIDQTLDDSEIHYARVGNVILLKIRPYQEKEYRYLVYNEKIQQAVRIDTLRDACVLLPDDHGLIFNNGYYLQTGERKTFDTAIQGLIFERRIASPNGEDTLYVFYQPDTGVYVLLGYNVIAQRVDTPVVCSGFTLFHGGEMLQFKAHADPQKHHAIQIWQTPYVGNDYVPEQTTDSYLYKIGNRDIVRGMAESHEVLALIEKEDTYAGLYLDLVKQTTDVLDSYFWVSHADAANIAEPLSSIRDAARSAVEEFDKVTRVRKNTVDQTARVTAETREILNSVGRKRFDNIDVFVKSLASLRSVRGGIIGLKELRYVDLAAVEGLEKEVTEATEKLSHRTVEFLLQPDALKPYAEKVVTEQAGIAGLMKVTDAKQLDERIGESARELEMLIEIVSNLKIDDATQRTAIIDNISAIFTQVNTARAQLKRRTQELGQVEGSAEFSSQLKLLAQAVVNYIDVCDTPEKCEEYLTKLMVQVEELEGKFAEFDEFIIQLAEKREEIAGAFETRRMQLIERRNQRANALAQAADRILKGIKSRVDGFTAVNDIHGYFASDLMIEKVRDIVAQLGALGDSVKVDDIQSRLKTIREDAVRQLKDRQELYEDGENVIRFGKHRFSVNTQVLDLTTVLRENKLHLHLTGTDFYEPLINERIEACRGVWDMEVVSENREVYRGEYLAYQMLLELRKSGELQASAVPVKPEECLLRVQQFMAPRYAEGYTKGVHDHDAALLLAALIEIDTHCGLLRYSSPARTLAGLYWSRFGSLKESKQLASKLAGVGAATRIFSSGNTGQNYIADLRALLTDFAGGGAKCLLAGDDAARAVLLDEAAEYLFRELTSADLASRGGQFVIAEAAAELLRALQGHLKTHGAEAAFKQAMQGVKGDPAAAYDVARDWMTAFIASTGDAHQQHADYVHEAAALTLQASIDQRAVIHTDLDREIAGLVGTHPVIKEGGMYMLRFNRFLSKLNRFARDVVPAFKTYHEVKTQTVDAAREEMKLAEFQPRVLSSFVRNKLIDSVYLPLIGDNLAKQVGSAGDTKRTDRQGLLLLISPPGYGKTTLMEYIANRLGIIFMKINGPAIGHEVKSVDPAAATNAGAREEIEKLNLAFEMGDNVMIYLDDIQHCHPEFLQKFISLCDAQRKIEGVYKGKTRTYDFRGKKVAVVMAGNPYTESGEKFQIPDMLANRADIYNLGEIIGDTREAFEMSYLENALTSNPVLTKLGARSQKDVYGVIKMAERVKRGEPSSTEGVEFEGSYSAEELNEYVATMVKLMRVRDVVLTINREYIASAAQHDDYRTEPPFLLQGSYRNMNRIAEKVLPVMNDDELTTLIVSSYQNDAQTLTSGTESNLLKFKELTGLLTPNEQERWDDIKRTFKQNVKLRGVGTDDKIGQVIATLSTFSDGLSAIQKAVSQGALSLASQQKTEQQSPLLVAEAGRLNSQLESLAARLNENLIAMQQLASRPIQVEMPEIVLPDIHVPPIEMQWPEQPPTSVAPQSTGGRKVRQVDAAGDESGEEADESDSGRITVVNKLPRTVLDVMESQFRLMQEWIKPLSEGSRQQRQEFEALRKTVQECLRSYEALLGRLEAASNE
jgi:hypothetical protein